MLSFDTLEEGAPSGWRHNQDLGVSVSTQNLIRQHPRHFKFQKW